MAWKTECDAIYLRKRLNDFRHTVEVNEVTGCGYSTLATRSNGDAQLKLRWISHGKQREAAPRPWTVDYFLRGIDIPSGHDASHLCGNGLRGCVRPEHIIIEPHEVNLDRKDCHKLTQCPCPCAKVHRVRPVCNHTPNCL